MPKSDSILTKEDLGWHVTQRWQSYEGEIRAAILRAILIAIFYSVQLFNYFVFTEGTDSDISFHRNITFLCAGWSLISLAVLVALRRQFFPLWLKYCTSSCDLLLLTLAAALGSGPTSPLILCFGLLITMSALRANLSLVWFVTITACLCYVGLVGLFDKTWFDANHATPPISVLVTLATLASIGVVTGQIVRLFRNAADMYAERLDAWQDPQGASEDE